MFRLINNRRLQQSGWLKKTFLTLGIICCTGAMLMAQGSYHHLVLGSYKTFEKASEAMGQAEQISGAQASILFPDADTDWYRVSVYQSTNRAEVEGFSQNLQRQGKPKGWILTLSPSQSATRSAAQASTSAQRTASASSSRYHLVMGSYQTYEKAEEGMNSLRTKGLEPYIVFPAGDVQAYRVSVYAAGNREEVQAYSTMLARSGHSGAWIYEEASSSTSVSPIGNTSGSNTRVASSSVSNGATFYLIGGSFERYDEATEYVEASRSIGATPEILWPENGEQGNFRVSLKSSKVKAEVEAYKRELAAGGHGSFWILAK